MSRQPSSIDRLPPTVRALIGELRRGGRTIDEILSHLRELDVAVSRSAMGRHVKGLAAISERLERSRAMATALIDRFGAEPDDKLQRLNLELLHGVIMQVLTATEADEETGELRPVDLGPLDAARLAKALSELANARKTDTDRTVKERQSAAKEAGEKIATAAKARGISGETIDSIVRDVLGVEQ